MNFETARKQVKSMAGPLKFYVYSGGIFPVKDSCSVRVDGYGTCDGATWRSVVEEMRERISQGTVGELPPETGDAN